MPAQTALGTAKGRRGLSFPQGRGSAEPPRVSVFGQRRRNLAAANYGFQILRCLQSAVFNYNRIKHTPQCQFSEVLVEEMFDSKPEFLFQQVKSHLKGATYEPFISLSTPGVLSV